MMRRLVQRALRRAAKVSIGAVAGAVACAVVAVGGVDGAAVLADDAEPADDDGVVASRARSSRSR